MFPLLCRSNKKETNTPPPIKNKSNCLFKLNLNTKGTYIHTYIIYAEEKKRDARKGDCKLKLLTC